MSDFFISKTENKKIVTYEICSSYLWILHQQNRKKNRRKRSKVYQIGTNGQLCLHDFKSRLEQNLLSCLSSLAWSEEELVSPSFLDRWSLFTRLEKKKSDVERRRILETLCWSMLVSESSRGLDFFNFAAILVLVCWISSNGRNEKFSLCREKKFRRGLWFRINVL
jgi:hypothetical protein